MTPCSPNETAREQFIRIEPGKSILRFFDIIDGRPVLESSNHTLEGTVEALEPHALRVAARPGRYELRVRVENAVDAIQVFGEFFNVTPPQVRGIVLGSAEVEAKESVTPVPLQVPATGGEKRIVVSYDASVVKAQGVFGPCKSSWQNDASAGRISVVLPAGCGAANLTFLTSRANATSDLKVINASGFLQRQSPTAPSLCCLGAGRQEEQHGRLPGRPRRPYQRRLRQTQDLRFVIYLF